MCKTIAEIVSVSSKSKNRKKLQKIIQPDVMYCVFPFPFPLWKSNYHPYTDQIIGLEQVLDSIKACKSYESVLNALVKLSQATDSQGRAVATYEGRWRPVPHLLGR
jgi:hypothetical protein